MAKRTPPRPAGKPAAPKAPTDKPAHARRRLEETPAPGANYVSVKITLPVWYMRQIEDEAKRLNLRRRTQFLELLVNRGAGHFEVHRGANAPAVPPPTAQELVANEYYMWHCPVQVKATLDAVIARNGGMMTRTWLMMQVNDWLGWPLLLKP